MSTLPALALTATLYVAWNIGASDTANAMGTAVGARIITYRRAITFFILFVLLGAMLEGWKLIQPVGKEIITGPIFQLHPHLIFFAMLCAGVAVMISTKYGFPVSTHQAIVGGLTGAGVAACMFASPSIAAQTGVNLDKIVEILIAWGLTPVGAMVFAAILCHGFRCTISMVKDPAKLNSIFSLGVIVTGCYVAYVMGANDLGTVMGGFYATQAEGTAPHFVSEMTLAGAAMVAIGSICWGERVVKTVGRGIAPLSPMTALVAQLSASVTIHLFTQWGLPVSMSQAIVSSVVGVGWAMDISMIRKEKVKKMILMWIIVPLIATMLSFSLASLFLSAM